MPEPTRADESLALRTTLLCGLVVVLVALCIAPLISAMLMLVLGRVRASPQLLIAQPSRSHAEFA